MSREDHCPTLPLFVAQISSFAAVRRVVGDEEQPLPTPVQHYFNSKKYDAPTPIQAQSLPLTLRGRDVVAVAQTGASGLA